MLKFKCKTNDDAIRDFLLKALEYIITCMKDALVTLCKECDERARNNDGGWKDRTGNLRSSIGGAVFDKGVEYFMTDFKRVLGGNIGSAEGRKMAEQFARQYTDTVIMVMVAGMPYSVNVEALDSKDVLESTRLWAESVVRKRLEEAKTKAERDINYWKL